MLVPLIAACATPAEHRNFREVMERQVGKSVDDPDSYPVFYRLRQVKAKSLANGNQQQEYAAGRSGRCRLFFEVEPLSRRIVRWSFEGSERECVIPARTPA
ncbi:MAG: hypothetical protein ABR570_15180 [Burkholderiales bacterium]